MKWTEFVSVGVYAITAVSLTGCGSSPSVMGRDVFVGTYSATSFVTTPTVGQPRDELQAGSTVTLTLNEDGSTTGHLHIAASASNPAFDADLTGTWARSANTVDLTESADTFIRDMNFTATIGATAETLSGDQVFSGTRVQLTLTLLPSAV
jgi:hypothetical protein